MNNGDNDFGVSFSQIMFLERILASHENVKILLRHDDIAFDIFRPLQGDNLTIVCVEAYSVSLELVERVVRNFPDTSIIYFGGKWNGATKDAHEFCDERGIGLFNAGTLSPALRRHKFGSSPKTNDQESPPDSAIA